MFNLKFIKYLMETLGKLLDMSSSGGSSEDMLLYKMHNVCVCVCILELSACKWHLKPET